MSHPKGFISLHRYFKWSNLLYEHFESTLNDEVQSVMNNKSIIHPIYIHPKSVIYMSYWLGSLYVVIEGWRQLNLIDVKIDQLLDGTKVKTLKNYRHCIFHFQESLYPKRMEALIVRGRD